MSVWQAARDIANAFLLVYAGLYPIIDPVSSAPLFIGLTAHASERERRALARGVALNSFFLLLGSLVIGSHVLAFFGITLPILRVGGGIVVSALGWRLLQQGEQPGDPLADSATSRQWKSVDAFYPLTMPLTVGPGSISVAITLGSQWPVAPHDYARLALVSGAALLGLVAIAATIYVCYRYAGIIVRKLGPQGINVLVRLSAFILFCIGIQIIWNGVSVLIGRAG